MLLKRSPQSKATVFDISHRVNVHILAPLLAKAKSPQVIHFKNKRRVSIEGTYPELPRAFGAMEERSLIASLQEFIANNMIDPNQQLMIKIQRTYTYPQTDISIPNLFHHGTDLSVYHKGVLCISRENIKGGLHQLYDNHSPVLSTELRQGDVLYFKDLDHTMVPIRPIIDKEESYIDLITFFELES